MFLLRNSHPVVLELPTISEKKIPWDARATPKSAATLEGLIAEEGDSDLSNGSTVPTSKHYNEYGNHLDVAEDEGWITIPKCKFSEDSFHSSNIQQLRSLDRHFVFPGERICLLVCLSASKQEDEETTTPAIVSGILPKTEKSTEFMEHQNDVSCSISSPSGKMNDDGLLDINADSRECSNVFLNKTLIQKKDCKQSIEALLVAFKCSNFFVRIAEYDEPLFSRRIWAESFSANSEFAGKVFQGKDDTPRNESCNSLSSIVDQGNFDCSASGGLARDAVKCYSLPSGDIVAALQVNIAVGNVKDPVLEVLQFEKYGAFLPDSENSNQHSTNNNEPCGELLNWLLPLDRTPPHSLSPPSGQSQTIATHRSNSSYSGSQGFSFSQFRSYSMLSTPQDNSPSISATHHSRPTFDLEDLDHLATEKAKTHGMENEGLLSFRGISLVPERFSVHFGFQGIYLPGRRWRRKIEIVQPLEIHSFTAACTTEDLLCVQIKNISPAYLPDITIFLDAITVIYDEPSKGSPPFSLPLSSIKTGGGHTLPNLPLRRGEEHSFILKPVTKISRNLNECGKSHSTVSHPKITTAALSASKMSNLKNSLPSTDQYAVLVSCRCDYTESKLFFKHRTSWRPHIAKDLIISVVSEISYHTAGSTGVPQLPVQVLTLHASNLTSEELNLTVLAPLSSDSPSSVLPLISSPRSPITALTGFSRLIGKPVSEKDGGSMRNLSSVPFSTEKQKAGDKLPISFGQRRAAPSDLITSNDQGCTHLWLQSTVPLGIVPAHSSTSARLELLPLTDGIITLDTIQIVDRDKGITYIPEQPLKIYATSSIASGN